MHPLRALLLSLLAVSPLIAQPRPLAPLRPVSVARTGIVSSTTGLLSTAGWNGSEHLVVWDDYRARTGSGAELRDFSHGQARLIAADGSLGQAITLPYKFWPGMGALWTGEQWVVLGAYSGFDCAASCVGAVRISREGVLLDQQVRLIEQHTADNIIFGLPVSSAVWTGSHIILGVLSPGFRASAVVLSEELEITATHRLATGDSDIAGVASDGETAMVVYRTPAETYAAVLDATGRLLKHERLFSRVDGEPYGEPYALTSGGGRYLLATVGSAGAANAYRISAWDISPELAVTPFGEAALQSTQAFDEFYETSAEVIWDGARYTVFATATPRGTVEQLVHVAHFSAAGQTLTPVAAPFLEIDPIGGTPIGISAGEGSILFLTYEFPRDSFELNARVAPAVEAIPDAPKQRLETGTFQQEAPAAATSGQQSLVAWLERTDPQSRPRLFATRVDARGNVLDPESLDLGEAFCQSRPGVASNGDGFVVAWHDGGLKSVRIGADGSAGPVHTTTDGGCFRSGPVTMTGNGQDYLAAWASLGAGVAGISMAVLRGDGSFVTPHLVNLGGSSIAEVYPASDGRDYLVAWESRAVRITASGTVLDSAAPLDLGPGRVRFLWWNGTTYVAAMVDGGTSTGRIGVVNGHLWRFVRIASDGTVTRSSAAPLQIPELGTFAVPFASACDATGCTLPISTARNHTFGLTLLRLEDDGTNITASATAVPNYAVPAPVEWPLPAGLLDTGEPIAVLQQMTTAAPHHGVHRLFVARFGTPKVRSVRR